MDNTDTEPSHRSRTRDHPQRPRHPLRRPTSRTSGRPSARSSWSRRRTRSGARARSWLAVLRAQAELGIDVPDGVDRGLPGRRRPGTTVDLDSIAARERVTRHDVKARIEEFSALAGHEHIHKGMTCRDLTENVEQLQVRPSLELVRDRVVAALARLARLAAEHDDAGDGRPLAQRRRAGDDAGQALRDRRRRAADRARAASRTCSRATRCAASRARSAPRRTCSTCSTATPTSSPTLEERVAAHLGFDARAHQRRAGLPALPRLRRGLRAGPAGRRAVLARHDDPADGRQRAGHRGLQGGPGRLVGDAAQDEHPLLRARQRPRGRPARLRVDDRRARRRPVERGRRLLLGGAPGRAARRVLRRRRPASRPS